MISMIQEDLKMVNGVLRVVPKEFPDWYGIEDVGFIWHGEWADPEIEYKGKLFNVHDVEDCMWERFTEESYGDYDYFPKYMYEHKDEVYELLEDML